MKTEEDLKLEVVEVGTKRRDKAVSRSIDRDMIERQRSETKDF